MRTLTLSLFALLSLSASAATVALEDAGPVVTLEPGFEPMAILFDGTADSVPTTSFPGQAYTEAAGWSKVTLNLDTSGLEVRTAKHILGNFEIQDLMSMYNAVVVEENDFAGLHTAVEAVRFLGDGEVYGATWNWKTLSCELELDDFGECSDRCDDQGYPGSSTDTAWADGGCVLLCTCYNGDGDKMGVFIEEDDYMEP